MELSSPLRSAAIGSGLDLTLGTDKLNALAAGPRGGGMHEIDISRLVDTARLRPFHFWLTLWCMLAVMADGFDLLNASIAGPALIKEWGISRAALGPVFSASLVGFLVGAPFFGYSDDRFGRRLTTICSLILVGLTTLACAWATNVQELLWLRVLSVWALAGCCRT